jgi:hypothetical protein
MGFTETVLARGFFAVKKSHIEDFAINPDEHS